MSIDPCRPRQQAAATVAANYKDELCKAMFPALDVDHEIVQEPSEDIEALRSFFQNTWNAQRSQLPVMSHKPQLAVVNGDLSRAIPAIYGNKPVQQSSMNGMSGQMPRQAASLPTGWHSMQVRAFIHNRADNVKSIKAYCWCFYCVSVCCASQHSWNLVSFR